MVLKENIDYWKKSLGHPEPAADEYYIFDEIIVSDKRLIKNVERLRELIISYCVLIEKDEKAASKILDEIYRIIIFLDKIQYTEFIAFWKALDMSYSIFKNIPNQKVILTELLKKYCERRRKLYDTLGYSNVTVQALYDSGTSRRKGASGIIKLVDLTGKIFGEVKHVKHMYDLERYKVAYFLPDKGDKGLFKEFCKKHNVKYQFGKDHQGKDPDIVLKVNGHFFIIEAKHIKEPGGAQNKQIVETIEFIKYSETSDIIHYVSFMDGVYFNYFIWASAEKSSKVNRQKSAIESHLRKNKNNFFVNTFGIKTLFEDLKKEIK